MALRPFVTVPSNTREWAEWCRKQFITADTVAPDTVATNMIIDGAVTNAKLRDSAALSVIGRAVNSTGDPADIGAGSDLTVLRRSGAVIGFGTVTSAYVSDFNEACQDAALAALTDSSEIDWTYNDGSGTASASIIANSISNTLIRDSAALSVIGRSANSAGDPADIAAANDAEVLRRSGATLGFGTVATAGLTNDAVTNAKLADMAQDTIKGRTSGAGTGDPVDLTAAQVATIVSTAVASALNITQGASYTPTLTNVTNVSASTANLSWYVRVGSMVVVMGFVGVDPTAAGSTEVGISLPIASNLGANTDLIGVAAALAVSGQSAGILGDTANDRARLIWNTVDTANNNMFYLFMYRVI
jgi:hypothetical protein